jgi:hypothetical protein
MKRIFSVLLIITSLVGLAGAAKDNICGSTKHFNIERKFNVV